MSSWRRKSPRSGSATPPSSDSGQKLISEINPRRKASVHYPVFPAGGRLLRTPLPIFPKKMRSDTYVSLSTGCLPCLRSLYRSEDSTQTATAGQTFRLPPGERALTTVPSQGSDREV